MAKKPPPPPPLDDDEEVMVKPPPPPPPSDEEEEQPTNGKGSFLDVIPDAVPGAPLGKTVASAAVGLGKSIWNTAFNQVPKEYALENLRNSQGTLADYINPSGANIQNSGFDFPEADALRTQYGQWNNRQSYAVRRMPNEEKADLFLKQALGEEKIKALAGKFNSQLTDFRLSLLKDAEAQGAESESIMKGEAQSVRDVKSLNQAGSYIGSMGGQGVGRIASSILTGGAGSIIAERAAGYEGQLDKLAKLASDQTGISTEDAKKAIIRLNQDKPEAGRVLSDLAGALDIISLGALGTSTAWKSVVPMIFEVATEVGQSEIEEKVASLGAGTKYEYDPVRSVDSALGAVIGAKAVTTVSSAIQKNANTGDPALNKEIDNAAGLTAAEAEELEGLKPPPPAAPEIPITETTKPTENAIQEQSTSGQVSHPAEAGQDLTQSSEGVRQGEQGEETSSQVAKEAEVTREAALQEKVKAKRKTLQDKVNELYSEWVNGGESAMPEELVQARRNLDALDKLTKQREERLAEEKEQETQNPGNTPGTPVTPKVSSNPKYKAQKAVVDQAYSDALVDGQYDMEKLDVARKEAEKLNEIANEVMRKQEVSKEKAESETVVTSIAKLREEFYKHMEQGAKLGRKALNDLLTKITDLPKKTPDGKHKLTPRQIYTLVNLVKRTNVNSKKHQERFAAKVAQIIKKADYAEQLGTAERLRELIKKATRGKLAKDVHKAAKLFSRIEPDELGEDLGPYIGHAYDIVNHYKKPGGNAYAPTSATAIQLFAEKTNSNQRQAKIDKVRDEFGFGEEVSDEDILRYLENEEEGIAQEDPFAENADEAKRKTVRDRLLKTAEYAQLGLKEASSEEGKFGKEHKAKADLIARMDLSKLNNAQLVDYIRTVDDMTVNDDFSGTDRLAARATAIENAAQLRSILKELKTKLTDVSGFKQAVYSLPQIFKLVYTGSKVAAEAYRLSGLDGYFNSTARVENQEDKQNHKYLKKFKELKKKFKDFDRAHTQVDASIFATLVRYPKGMDPVEALARSKQIIETSIQRLKSKKDHQAIAADAERTYQKFKDAKTIDEVFTIMKKESPGAYQMWEFWRDSYKNDIMERLKQSSREFYNDDFVEEENYTPKKFVTLEGNIPEPGEDGPTANKNAIGGRRQSVTSKAATGNLRPNQSLDFNFYDNMFKGWTESLYQIETTKPQQILHEFLALPESAELLGGEDNRKGILDTWKKSDEIARAYGGTTGNRAWNEVGSALKLLSNIKALGGIYQFPKQYLSVATSTLGNLGEDAGLFFTVKIPEGANKLFDQYSIGNRGKRLAGAERGESRYHHLQSAYAKGWVKTIAAINRFSEKGAHVFLYALRKGDVSVAQRSWAAYYLQSLKESGIDIKNINLADEALLQDQEVRQKAAAYAEQKVKETQLTSNPEEQARVLKTAPGAASAIKNVVIPFSSFAINTKVRVLEGFNRVRKNPDSTEAWRELGTVASEILVYNGVKTYLLGMITETLVKPVIESMFDVEGGDDPEREKKKKQNQKFWSDMFKDAFPTTIGSAGTSATVTFFNYVDYLVRNPHMSYKQWKKKKKELFSNFNKEGFDYGLYGVLIDGVMETATDTKLAYDIMTDKKIYIQNQWGGDKHVRLTRKEERFMIWNTLFEYASIVGMMDADIFNAVQKTQRGIIKRGEKRAAESDAETGAEPPE